MFCPFCLEKRFDNNKKANLPAEECTLFQSENFYVQTDIAPLVRGHIMLIPHKHYLAFNQLPEELKDEARQLKEYLKKIYKEVYNSDVLFFEHGSAKSGLAGASIDHAHLHCMPDTFNINPEIEQILGKPSCFNVFESENELPKEKSYIYSEYKEKENIYIVEKLPSQFLRKIISDKLNSQGYMWQELSASDENRDKIESTIKDLQEKFTSIV